MNNGTLLKRMLTDRSLIQKPFVEPMTRNLLPTGHGVSLGELSRDATRSTALGVEIIARCFRREFGYDFPPFTADEWLRPGGSTGQQVYLLTSGEIGDWRKGVGYLVPLVGVVGMARDFYTNLPPGTWTLTWAWLHPYNRGHGVLSSVWPHIIAKHGNICVQPPYSSAMRAFLDKRRVGTFPGCDAPRYGIPEAVRSNHEPV
jgi:hypothetical protein